MTTILANLESPHSIDSKNITFTDFYENFSNNANISTLPLFSQNNNQTSKTPTFNKYIHDSFNSVLPSYPYHANNSDTIQDTQISPPNSPCEANIDCSHDHQSLLQICNDHDILHIQSNSITNDISQGNFNTNNQNFMSNPKYPNFSYNNNNIFPQNCYTNQSKLKQRQLHNTTFNENLQIPQNTSNNFLPHQNEDSSIFELDHPDGELTFLEKLEAGLVEDPSNDTSEDDENSDYIIYRHINKFKYSFEATNSHNFGNNAYFRRFVNYLSILDESKLDLLSFNEKLALNLVHNPDSFLPEDLQVMSKIIEFVHVPATLNACPFSAVTSDSSRILFDFLSSPESSTTVLNRPSPKRKTWKLKQSSDEGNEVVNLNPNSDISFLEYSSDELADNEDDSDEEYSNHDCSNSDNNENDLNDDGSNSNNSDNNNYINTSDNNEDSDDENPNHNNSNSDNNENDSNDDGSNSNNSDNNNSVNTSDNNEDSDDGNSNHNNSNSDNNENDTNVDTSNNNSSDNMDSININDTDTRINNDIRDTFYLHNFSFQSQTCYNRFSYNFSFDPSTKESISSKMYCDSDSDDQNDMNPSHNDSDGSKPIEYDDSLYDSNCHDCSVNNNSFCPYKSFYGYNDLPLPKKFEYLCWQYDDDLKLVKLLETHGQQWDLIARHFTKYSMKEIIDHYHFLINQHEFCKAHLEEEDYESSEIITNNDDPNIKKSFITNKGSPYKKDADNEVYVNERTDSSSTDNNSSDNGNTGNDFTDFEDTDNISTDVEGDDTDPDNEISNLAIADNHDSDNFTIDREKNDNKDFVNGCTGKVRTDINSIKPDKIINDNDYLKVQSIKETSKKSPNFTSSYSSSNEKNTNTINKETDTFYFSHHKNKVQQSNKKVSYSFSFNPLTMENCSSKYFNDSVSDESSSNEGTSIPVKDNKDASDSQISDRNLNRTFANNEFSVNDASNTTSSNFKDAPLANKSNPHHNDTLSSIDTSNKPPFHSPRVEAFDTHTNSQLYYRVDSSALSTHKRSPFSLEEDERLLQLIKTHGTNNWESISKFIPSRTARQCRERYNRVLNLYKGNSSWSNFEDEILLNYYWRIGPRWNSISKFLKQHNARNVRNRCQHLLKKTLPFDSSIDDFLNFDSNRTSNDIRPICVEPTLHPLGLSIPVDDSNLQNVDDYNYESYTDQECFSHSSPSFYDCVCVPLEPSVNDNSDVLDHCNETDNVVQSHHFVQQGPLNLSEEESDCCYENDHLSYSSDDETPSSCNQSCLELEQDPIPSNLSVASIESLHNQDSQDHINNPASVNSQDKNDESSKNQFTDDIHENHHDSHLQAPENTSSSTINDNNNLSLDNVDDSIVAVSSDPGAVGDIQTTENIVTLQATPFIERLSDCLNESDDSDTIVKLNLLQDEFQHDSSIVIDMNSSIVDLLLSTSHWPAPIPNTCFFNVCDHIAESEGTLRIHLRNAHRINTTKSKDEIVNIISFMTNKEILPIYDLRNGHALECDNLMILCHCPGCSYISDRDSNMLKHRKMHKSFNDHLFNLGRFWGSLKDWYCKNKAFPTISSFLGSNEVWICAKCDFAAGDVRAIKNHLARSHGIITNNDLSIHANNAYLSFIFKDHSSLNNPNIDATSNTHLQTTELPSPIINSGSSASSSSSNNNNLESGTPSNDPCINHSQQSIDSCPDPNSLEIVNTFPPTAISSTTQSSDTPTTSNVPNEILTLFNNNTLATCKNDPTIFKNLLTIALNHNDDSFHFLLNLLKQAPVRDPSINSPPTSINSCISEILSFASVNLWPPPSNLHFCPRCNQTFVEHSLLLSHECHNTNNEDCLDELLMIIQSLTGEHIECRKVDHLGRSSTFSDSSCICRVPGCSFVASNFDDLNSHLFNRDDSHHKTYVENCSKYGAFFGAIKSFVILENKLPSINELLRGKYTNNYSCKICHKILAPSSNSVRKHFERFHQNDISKSITDKVVPIRLIFTESLFNNNEDTINEYSLRMVREAGVELLNHLREEELLNAVDNAYFNLLENEDQEELVNNSSTHSSISATRIVQRNDTTSVTDVPTNLVNHHNSPVNPISSQHISPYPNDNHNINDIDVLENTDSMLCCHNNNPLPDVTNGHPIVNDDNIIDNDVLSADNDSSLNTPTLAVENSHVSGTSTYIPPHRRLNVERSYTKRTKRTRRTDMRQIDLPTSLSSHILPSFDPIQRRIAQGLKWLNDAKCRTIVRLPKLNRDSRKIISPGLRELFVNEIIPLIKEYSPDKLGNCDQETKWNVFEGAYEESLHRIRIHIAIKLGLNPDYIYRNNSRGRFINNNLDELTSIQSKLRSLRHLAADIDKVNSNDVTLSAGELECIKRRIMKNILSIPVENRIEMFNNSDALNITEEICHVENKASECAEWLELKIPDLIKKEMSLKRKNVHAKRLQESYADNPRKTLNNFIFNKVSPECQIDERSLRDYFASTFSPNNHEFVPDVDGIFALHNSFSDEDKCAFMDSLLDKEAIVSVIKSRKFDSAAGPDGIDYTIYKLVPDSAADFILSLSSVIIEFGRVPKNWKQSIMRLIFKKGNPEVPNNWRPISISNSIYRIFSCMWARTINSFNSSLHIFSPNQRGFIANINGCSDNASIISELYCDAIRRKKSIIITALDFKNAFGSVPHDMIINSLLMKGFPSEFINIIKDVYTGSTTKITTSRFTSEDIDVKKGTKQGCPVSPLLFNLCLEPLFEAISSINFNDGYNFDPEDRNATFSILAYADDILLISESENGMENLLRTCEAFCAYSGMVLAPSKSCSFGYLYKDRRRCGLSQSFTINNEEIPYVDLDDSIRYLGTPIAARKVAKLKSSADLITKFQSKAMQIFNSDLLIVQKIHAFKTFLIPSLDFILQNGQMKVKHIEKVDDIIGSLVNKMIGGALPNAIKHASWKDGGLSIPSIKEKSETGKIKSFLRMLLNKDDLIKKLACHSLVGERIMRNIDVISTPENQIFLDWDTSSFNNESPGTNSIINRARKSLVALDLKLSFNYNNELTEDIRDPPINFIDWMHSTEMPSFELTDTCLDKSIILKSTKNLSLFLTERRRDRWKSQLSQCSFHLHSMLSFIDNPLSNDFAVRQQYPVSDRFFKFAFASRANMLPTPEFIECMTNQHHTPCPMCLQENKSRNQSLAHILNGCRSKFNSYTIRHNDVQKVIVDNIKSLNGIQEIHTDKSLHLNDMPDDLKLLRPDIVAWFNNRSRCVLVEISIPYGCQRWGDDSLSTVYTQKKDKYARLVNHIRNKGIDTELYVIIASSLGAVFSKSINELNKLFHPFVRSKSIIKRISRSALIGSMNIWFSYHKRKQSGNLLSHPVDQIQPSSSIEDGEVNDGSYCTHSSSSEFHSDVAEVDPLTESSIQNRQLSPHPLETSDSL